MVYSMISAAVRDKGTGKVFGDMHKFVDDGADFIIFRKFVKMMRQNFDDVVRRV